MPLLQRRLNSCALSERAVVGVLCGVRVPLWFYVECMVCLFHLFCFEMKRRRVEEEKEAEGGMLERCSLYVHMFWHFGMG